jgi:hypothetical protein
MDLEAIIKMLRINEDAAYEDQKTRHVIPDWKLDSIKCRKKHNPNYEYVPEKYDLLEEYIHWCLEQNNCETGMYITDKGSYIFGIKFQDIGTVYHNKFTSVSSLVTMITEANVKFMDEMSRLGADLTRIQLQPMEWPNDEDDEKWGPIFIDNVVEPFVFTWDN